MHFFWLAIVLISSCFCPSLSSYLPQTPNTAFSNGFSVDLIHRDSPLSPYYNPAATQSERWRAAARHSISRLRCSHRTKTNPRANDCGLVTTVTEFGGAYLIPLTFGTPPRRFLLNADTGSDLIWIQCTDCKHCFPQDVPLFEPSKSSTYLYIPCDAPVCRSQYVYVCDTSRGNLCGYYYSYGDGTEVYGSLSLETISLISTTGETWAFPRSIFGCTHFDAGLSTIHEAGLVGLGTGDLSLISQLGPKIDNRFSYCLLPTDTNQTSTMSFGGPPIASRYKDAVSTPLFKGVYYYASLEGVTVEGKTFRLPPGNRTQQGNIVIDSGSTLTSLDPSLTKSVEGVVAEKLRKLKRVKDDSGQFNLCYFAKNPRGLKLPGMVLHFSGGADVKMKPENVFIFTDDDSSDASLCLAVLRDEMQLLGNVAMANFQVEYDLKRNLLTFAPANCLRDK